MDANLKILHLSSEKSWRGGEQQIAYLIDELAARGVNNYVAVRKDSAFETYARTKGLEHHSFGFRNIMDVSTAVGLKRYCRKNQIDLIHLHSAKSHGIGVLSAALGNKTPMILSRRVDFVPKSSLLTRWRYNHPAIRSIAGVSERITEIMKAYVSNPSKCVTIHSGIDTQKFSSSLNSDRLRKEFGVAEGTHIVGNTSALEGHKDYYTFIRTIKILQDKNFPVKAFIIGEGSLKEKLLDEVARLHLGDVIVFTGFRKDIVNLLPSLDIFLITSETEGLGTSVLDAFAARVPVVATAAGGIPEMIRHRVTGMLHPAKDAEGLSESIIEISQNEELRTQLTDNAYDILQQFSKRTTAEKTLALYRKVLSNSQH